MGAGNVAVTIGYIARRQCLGYPMRLMLSSLLLLCCAAAHGAEVALEDLTTTQVRAALSAGHTVAIVPVGGTEQNGPHMVLGKHNQRVRALAARIARELGNALVAPVLSYVPEGQISPPTEHMRHAGTLSIPDAAFKSVLAATGRSLKQHGFTDIVYLGDSGNYQHQLQEVAVGLNKEWAGRGARAHFIKEYYQAAQAPFMAALRAKGLSDAQIGSHAGAADTALLMALHPAGVHAQAMPRDMQQGASLGVRGDPRAASVELGQLGVDLIVTRSVAAIRQATSRP